jgi:hypothetical protein
MESMSKLSFFLIESNIAIARIDMIIRFERKTLFMVMFIVLTIISFKPLIYNILFLLNIYFF